MIDYISRIDDLYDLNSISMLEYAMDALDIADEIVTEGKKFDKFKNAIKPSNVWGSFKEFLKTIWGKIKEFCSKHFSKKKALDAKLKAEQEQARKAIENAKVKGSAGRILKNIAKVSDALADDGKNAPTGGSGRSRIIILKRNKVDEFISEVEDYTGILDTIYDMTAQVDSTGRGELDTKSVSQLTKEYQDMYNDKRLEEISDIYEETYVKDVQMILGILGDEKKYVEGIESRAEKASKAMDASYNKVIKKIESIENSAKAVAKARADKNTRTEMGDKGLQVTKNAASLAVVRKAITGRTQLFFKTMNLITKRKNYLHNYYMAVIKGAGAPVENEDAA